MALGGRNNNNQNQNYSSPKSKTYYPKFRINNPETEMSLTFRYNGWLLVCAITKYSRNNDQPDELITINLSPTKAKLLSDCFTRIIDDAETTEVFGIDTGFKQEKGLVFVGRDMGNPYIVIGKTSDGKITESHRFDFNMNYNYLLSIKDVQNFKCRKEFSNTVELEMVRELLLEFSKASYGAIAMSVHEINKFEANSLSSSIKKIAESVGVSMGSNNRSYNNDYNGDRNNNGNGSSGYRSNNSNGNNSSKRSYQSIDSLDDELDL